MRERYCQILGVPPHASIDQVKRAYRKRAKELHPDVAERADASQRFLEVKKAYEYLTNNSHNWTRERLSKPKYQYTQSPPSTKDKEHHDWWVKENIKRTEAYKKQKKSTPPEDYITYEKKLNSLSQVLKYTLLSVFLVTLPIAIIQMNMDEQAELKMNSYIVPTLLGVDLICMVIFLYAKSIKYIPKGNK